MGGGVGSPGQPERSCGMAKVVANCARLHPRIFLLGIYFEDLVKIFSPVNNYRHIATLSGQAGSATTGEHGRSEFATYFDGLDYVFNCFGNDDTDRNLPIVGTIHGIGGFAAGIKAN